MNDEELSEFAECLEDACQQAIAKGLKVVPVSKSYLRAGENDHTCNCPLGHMLNDSYPYRFDNEVFYDFYSAYDRPNECGSPGAVLGRQFQERYP